MTWVIPFFAQGTRTTIVIDGVTYRPPLIDAAGHVQVDVVSSALPALAATSTKQDTMITALQLIDDLRGALDAVKADRLNVNAYRDGASEVKALIAQTANNSAVRATALTPSSGKKVRIIGVGLMTENATATRFEVYFGTGAHLIINPTKIVAVAYLGTGAVGFTSFAWPDGGGPVGAADEVLSLRTRTNITTDGLLVLHYREE